jgi:hypothetical protein
MHVQFHRDFDWRPPERPRVVIAFKGGQRYFVRRRCADAALAKGACVVVRARATVATEGSAA